MILHKRLIYSLSLILVIGIVLVILLSPQSAWSRVATGLITGALVGLVNTIVNYYSKRQDFFESLIISILDVIHELDRDEFEANVRNRMINRTSKDDLIIREKNLIQERTEKSEDMRLRYDKLCLRFNTNEYHPLLSSKKINNILRNVDDIVFDIKYLYTDYFRCFSFSMLAADVSKEEQEIVIGDPDEFYKEIVQQNIDYQDLLNWNRWQLANVASSLSTNLKGKVSKNYIDAAIIIHNLTKNLLKGKVIRNVRQESFERLESDVDSEPNEQEE